MRFDLAAVESKRWLLRVLMSEAEENFNRQILDPSLRPRRKRKSTKEVLVVRRGAETVASLVLRRIYPMIPVRQRVPRACRFQSA